MNLALALVLFASTIAQSFIDFDAYCYVVNPGTKRTIAWVAEPGAVGYELQVRRMENGKTSAWRISGTKWEITWKTPGHYVVYVRWKKLINGVSVFGEWKNSLEHNSSFVLIGGTWTPRTWVIIVPTAY